MGGDNWRSTWECLERKNSWVFGAGLLWYALVLGQSLPGHNSDIVSVGSLMRVIQALVDSKLKPPGFLCYQPTAPTVSGHLVLQGQAGDASGSEGPSEPIFILPLPCRFQGGKIEDNGFGLGSNSTVWHPVSSYFKCLLYLLIEIYRFFKFMWQKGRQPGDILNCSGPASGKWLRYWWRLNPVGEGSNAKGLMRGKASLVVRLMHSCMFDLSFCCQPHAKALHSLGKCSERTPGYGSTTHVWCEALEPWGGKGKNPLSLCPFIGV